jgi:hypothetical protein
MQKRWLLITDAYDGLEKYATNLLSSAISGYIPYVLPVKRFADISNEDLRENNVVIVGKHSANSAIKLAEEQGVVVVPQVSEGYSVYVGESVYNSELQMIAIVGYDESGVLYGCVDFCNKYFGYHLHMNGGLCEETYFESVFNNKLAKWRTSNFPAIKTRAIWTWGHVIYDYKRFFENMVKLRLNEVVIWNDKAPLNAKDIVDYAHSLGIKLIWGFAWGWTTKCEEALEQFDDKTCEKIKQSVLETYKNEYANVAGDGIYFQSFTELTKESVGGRCIADIVTELVNDVSNALLEKYPDLHIQFGLHATSVKTKLDIIKKTDTRITIIWEDCGSFPYAYSVLNPCVDTFEETLTFTEKLLSLRGVNERFGAVLKGMLNLDWASFEHFTENYILGERSEENIQKRQLKTNRMWKVVQAGWLKYADYVRRLIAVFADKGKEPIVQALVENALFEEDIPFPAALYAEMLWTPQADTQDMIQYVASYPCVKFANI